MSQNVFFALLLAILLSPDIIFFGVITGLAKRQIWIYPLFAVIAAVAHEIIMGAISPTYRFNIDIFMMSVLSAFIWMGIAATIKSAWTNRSKK